MTGFTDWMELLKSASSQALGGIPPKAMLCDRITVELACHPLN
ncbi:MULTISPECIES: hypothetical protein [Moorena]|nr:MULTISPECIES: hypothetical protein [Moorena]